MSTNYPQGPQGQPDLDAGDKVTVIGEFSDGGDLGVTLGNAHVKG